MVIDNPNIIVAIEPSVNASIVKTKKISDGMHSTDIMTQICHCICFSLNILL